MLEWCKRHFPIIGWVSDPCLPCSTLHGSHCISREFTGSAKLVLEKQTMQPSLVAWFALYMCSVQVQPLAGPIKWNRPGVTVWSVFQNPVIFNSVHFTVSLHCEQWLQALYNICRACIFNIRLSTYYCNTLPYFPWNYPFNKSVSWYDRIINYW